MLSNFFELTILSAIQGISEFLPVSSSAHLILANDISNLGIGSIYLDTGMHLGSLLAVIFYFRNDLKKITKNKKLLYLMIFGSLPTIFLGAILYITGLINLLRSIEIIAWTTFIFAILLWVADKFKVEKKIDSDLNIISILLIGLFQMLSLIPGVSRSGIVITAGRFLNFDRFESSKISFYLSIPAIAGASFLTLKDLGSSIFDINRLTSFTLQEPSENDKKNIGSDGIFNNWRKTVFDKYKAGEINIDTLMNDLDSLSVMEEIYSARKIVEDANADNPAFKDYGFFKNNSVLQPIN